MPVYLKGLALQNFRGIGAMQKMAPFKEFNFFIGANNAGKSTVLSFISTYLPIRLQTPFTADQPISIPALDVYSGNTRGGISTALVSPYRISFQLASILFLRSVVRSSTKR